MDPCPLSNLHHQILNGIDKARVPLLGTLIGYSSMSISLDDVSAEELVKQRHSVLSGLSIRLIYWESKRKLVYSNNQTLTTPTTAAEIGEEIVHVLQNLQNLSSHSTDHSCRFGMRHWGITLLCEILIRLERRRKIEEENLLINEDGNREDLDDMLSKIDREIDACYQEFCKNDPIPPGAYMSNYSEFEIMKQQIARVNYSSENLRLYRKRLSLVKGSKTTSITDDDSYCYVRDQLEKARAHALEAFCCPMSEPSAILGFARKLLMAERGQDALVYGDSPKKSENLISMYLAGEFDVVDIEEFYKQLPVAEQEPVFYAKPSVTGWEDLYRRSPTYGVRDDGSIYEVKFHDIQV